MANTIIQVRRSNTSSSPASLNWGELAFSAVSNTLFIGANTGTTTAIATVLTPGTVGVANQVVAVNSTFGVNQLTIANASVSYLAANSSQGTSGFVLFSGGATSNAYWASAGAIGVNTAAQYTWTNNDTFSANVTLNANTYANNINAVSLTTGATGTGTGGVGSFFLTSWGSVYKWPSGVAPTLTTTAGARDMMSFFSDGTNMYGTYINNVK